MTILSNGPILLSIVLEQIKGHDGFYLKFLIHDPSTPAFTFPFAFAMGFGGCFSILDYPVITDSFSAKYNLIWLCAPTLNASSFPIKRVSLWHLYLGIREICRIIHDQVKPSTSEISEYIFSTDHVRCLWLPSLLMNEKHYKSLGNVIFNEWAILQITWKCVLLLPINCFRMCGPSLWYNLEVTWLIIWEKMGDCKTVLLPVLSNSRDKF